MPLIRACLYEEKTQHGKTRYRFIRSRGAPKIGIKGQPGDTEFENRYHFLLSGGDSGYESPRSKKTRQSRHREGTYADVVAQYLRHMDQEQTTGKIAEGTRKTYEGILRRTAAVIGQANIATIDEAAIMKILDVLTTSPATYNNMLKAMRRMFKFAKRKLNIIAENPTDGVDAVEYDTDGFKEWTTDQVTTFLDFHPVGSTAHLVLSLYIHTACRRSDVVQLGPQHLITQDGEQFLEFIQTKGRNRKRTTVTIPVAPHLADVLSRSKIGADTFVVNEYGRPFTAKGFGNRMRKWIDEARLPKNLSSHGVRKTIGNILAEAECTPYQIMAIQGHTSTKASEIYTRKAQRRKMAKQGFEKADIAKSLGLETK